MNLHTKRRLKAGVALLCSATMTFALATPYSFADEKETLENKGMITYLPTIYVKRRWKEQVKEIQIPAVKRCVFI